MTIGMWNLGLFMTFVTETFGMDNSGTEIGSEWMFNGVRFP